MPERDKVYGSLLETARERASESDWIGAAKSYEEALGQTPKSNQQAVGDILERKAYSLHRASLQADDSTNFVQLITEATKLYSDAKSLYSSISPPLGEGRRSRCDSMMAYLSYWLARDHEEKKRLADQAWRNARKSLDVFESSGNYIEFALTHNQVSYSAAFSYNHDGSAESRENTLKEALSYAEKAVDHLSSVDMPAELAVAHTRCTGLMVAIEKDFAPFKEKDKYDLNAWDHWRKATKLDEKGALLEIPFIVILQSWPAACSTNERNIIYEKGIEAAKSSRDKFVLGCVLDGWAQRKFCLAMSADDQREIDKLSAEGFEAAKSSKENLDLVHFVSPNVSCVWISVPEAGYYFSYASEESDTKTQRELFFKAHKPCIEQLKQAEISGYPDVVCGAHFMLGSVLKALGKSESGVDMKKSYLEKAVEHLREAIDGDKKIHPTEYYPQGLDLLSLADAHFEIAQITTDLEKKKKVLKEAVARKQEALALCEKELNATQDTNPDISGEIATGHHTTGKWARELCNLTADTSCLVLVVECLERAVVWYGRAGLFSQSAECSWEAAEAYEELGEYRKASERFEQAANNYVKAADSVPRLKEFYADHAIYMRAWSEIDQANYHHLRQEPGQAKEHYVNASAMHKSSRRWSYLATNYSAWAEVEHAEDLSRSEKPEEAKKAFEEAAHLFQESKNALHAQVSKIEDLDEKELARDLERAAVLRREFCLARIVLERARAFDKEGDVSASSEKYGEAGELFEKMLPELTLEQDRKELRLMAKLSRAWQAMAKAESETSPDFYHEASRLFEEARNLSTGENAKLLVAGHSRFCQALAMGTKFVETGDVALHAEATKHIESAASYYLKAGHQKESDFAKASKLLFDAYVHMGKASREEDQEKKAKLYIMAEKVLRNSAEAYEKAQQPSKKSQVLRLIDKVKEERDLALSLTGVIRAPDLFSSTSAFPSPKPSHETTTGLQKFEHADVQVTLIVHPKHLHVGQDVELEVEMTNAGKGEANLSRIEGIIPKDFEVVEKPEHCRIDRGHLTMRNRRIDPQRTEVVRLILRPNSVGKFSLRPRLIYGDEDSTHKDRLADPVEITVSEMGIMGWLKGSDRSR